MSTSKHQQQQPRSSSARIDIVVEDCTGFTASLLSLAARLNSYGSSRPSFEEPITAVEAAAECVPVHVRKS